MPCVHHQISTHTQKTVTWTTYLSSPPSGMFAVPATLQLIPCHALQQVARRRTNHQSSTSRRWLQPNSKMWSSSSYGHTSTLTFKDVPLPTSASTIACGILTGVPRPVVPSSFCRTMFNSLHSLSHPGVRATQRLVTARHVWPGINADVRKWAQDCLQCQRSKV